MGINPWFVLFAFVGLAAVMAGLVVSECNPGLELILDGHVVDKTVVVQRTEEPVRVQLGGCPSCPGSGPREATTSIVHEEEHRYLIVEAEEEGELRTYRVEVTPSLYDEIEVGTPVRIRIVRARTREFNCIAPEILLPEPTQ